MRLNNDEYTITEIYIYHIYNNIKIVQVQVGEWYACRLPLRQHHQGRIHDFEIVRQNIGLGVDQLVWGLHTLNVY